VRALLVDDNRADINLLQLALRSIRADMEIHTAEDGVKALELLRGRDGDSGPVYPDFILLDLKLPRKTGLEVLFEIKRDPELRGIPVVILTSSKAAVDIARAYDCQAAAYFVKPLSGFQGVLETIMAFLDAAQLPKGQARDAHTNFSGASISAGDPSPAGREATQPWPAGREPAAIVDGASDPIIGVTLDGTIATWNPAAESLYGSTALEAIGGSMRLVVPDERIGDMQALLAAIRRGGPARSLDSVRVDRGGRRLNVSIMVSPVRDERGDVVGASLIVREITAHTQEAEKLRLAVEFAPNAMVMVNASGEIVLVNAETEHLFGYPRAEVMGRPIDMLVPERFRGRHPQHRAEFMARPEARAMGVGRDLFGLRKDGTEFPVEIGLRPIETPQGTMVLSAIVDITERRLAEERFRLAVESAPNAMVMVDSAGRIVLVNAETERLFGWARAELIGQSIDMLVPERFRGRHPLHRADFMARPEVRAMGVGRELFGLRKDGTEFPVEIGLNPIHTASGTLVLSAIVDITERKLAEERFRLAVESSPSAMVMIDAAGCIVMVNAETERLFGYGRNEIVGRQVEILVPPRYRAGHPGLRDGFISRPEVRAMGAGRELFGLRKDGSEFPVEIGLNPIHTATGTLVLSAIVDITERKRAEEVLAQQRRELARSNAELEQFAYVASHDLQEPLRTVASYTKLLGSRYADQLDEDARTFIKFAQDGAIRMQSLIDALLAFSRVGTRARDPGPVDASTAVRQALVNLKASIQEAGATVNCGALPSVIGDSLQLVELFQNLIGNAVKFRSTRPPRIDVTARRDGAEWVFSVSDNGIGIDPQFFGRIFEVFQRLHGQEEYPGTGIGLAICKRIVERFGGRIWVESTPGAGTTFLFSLPAEGKQASPRTA